MGSLAWSTIGCTVSTCWGQLIGVSGMFMGFVVVENLQNISPAARIKCWKLTFLQTNDTFTCKGFAPFAHMTISLFGQFCGTATLSGVDT